MAYTKKTTAKKTTAKKVTKPVEPEVVEEVLDEEEVIEEAPAVKIKKEFHSDDMILCRSVTSGKLVMVGAATNMVYRWPDYGTEAEVEYRDLVSAVRSHSQFVYTPYFIVDNEDFINEFVELKKFYTERFTVKELADILAMNEGDMEDAIAVLPKGAREQIINLASTKIATGELDSVRKIKALERILGVDFSLVAEMG